MQWLILVVPAVVGLVLAVVALDRRAKRARAARTAALQRASGGLGLAFEAGAEVAQIKAVGDLPLFARGYGEAWNVMSGRAGTDAVKVFDYQYTARSGKSRQTWTQTIALYPGGAPGLPDFELAAGLIGVPVGQRTPTSATIESMIHKLTDRLGPDIDFDSSPAFSDRYILKGGDEAAIRAAFPEETRAFFEQHPGWTVEARAGNVGIYRAGTCVEPEEISTFLEDSRAVLRVVRGR